MMTLQQKVAARKAQQQEKGADQTPTPKVDTTPVVTPTNAEKAPKPSKPKVAKLTDEQMAEMTVKALITAAEERGVKGLAKKPKKADVSEAIKTAQAKKAPGVRSGPTIIGLCVELLLKASEDKPITKGEVFDEVIKAFTDKASTEEGKRGMWKTVSDSIPVDLRNRKGLVVSKSEKGYWLEPSQMTTANPALRRGRPQRGCAFAASTREEKRPNPTAPSAGSKSGTTRWLS